jgi:hypothetical protein
MNATKTTTATPPDTTGPALSTDRIHTPQTATTHYVSEFSLAARNGSQSDAFDVATRFLKAWAESKSKLPGFALREERHGGNAAAPEAWAFHLQHREPNADYRRYWYIDVSLHRRVGGFDVRVSISHCLDFGFVGWTPKPPEPSAPNFICDWLGHANLTLRSGQFPIAALAPPQPKNFKKIKDRISAMTVRPEGAEQLARLIFDTNRGLPVLVINGDVNPITFPLDPNKLQQLLLGTCYVVWVPTVHGWGEAWRAHFPKGFACTTNSVRLYQIGAKRDSTFDPVRHRFFTDDEIMSHGGSSAFVSMIRDGLTRRLLAPRPGRISSCEDVLALNAEASFSAQRLTLKTKEEELAFYEAEYTELVAKKQRADQLLQERDSELLATKSELDALRPYAESLAAQLDSAKQSAIPAFDHSDLLLRFFKNEASVADQLLAIQALHPDSVHLLPSALGSAKDASDFEQPDALREMLLKLATDFHRCLLDGKGTQEGVRIFGRKNFTTRESDNLSAKGRAARTFSYKGDFICMESHLKIGVKDSEAHCLRVHFHWDAVAKKIVIGHCGKHLPL